MQSVEIQGLAQVEKALAAAPKVIREARAEVFEEMGGELLGAVQRRIGGEGRVAGVQEYQVGSGKGYVAVRAMAKTDLDGYAAGYITNALEGGHAVRKASAKGKSERKRKSRAKADRVSGKYMYRDTGNRESKTLAETAARRIEEAAIKVIDGGA